jgi:hypothetical protein
MNMLKFRSAHQENDMACPPTLHYKICIESGFRALKAVQVLGRSFSHAFRETDQ